MSIHIRLAGSEYHTSRDVLNVITWRGEKLLWLKRRSWSVIALNMNVFDSAGSQVAVVRNSNVVQALDKYEYRHEARRAVLLEKATSRQVCVLQETPGGDIRDIWLDAFLPDGRQLILTPAASSIATLKMSGKTFNAVASAVNIGEPAPKGGKVGIQLAAEDLPAQP